MLSSATKAAAHVTKKLAENDIRNGARAAVDDAADALDTGDALYRLQRLGHIIVDEPGGCCQSNRNLSLIGVARSLSVYA